VSFESFDDFFHSGKSDKLKVQNVEMIVGQLFNFMEKSIMELAAVVDQLDAKVTAVDSKVTSLQKQGFTPSAPPGGLHGALPMSGGIPPPPSGLPSAPGGGLPPVPGGGLPPIPGASSSSGLPPLPGFGGLSPTPMGSHGGTPGAPAPEAKPNPMAVQAQLKNELAEAFKKIRQNLKEDA